MIKVRILIFLFVSSIVIPLAYPSPDETPQLLFKNVRSLMEEGRAGREKGERPVAAEKYRTAFYLLEKISQDFPDWSPQTVGRAEKTCRTALSELSDPTASPPPLPSEVTCSWKLLYPGSEFEEEAGEVYEISLEGKDRRNLTFSFKKLKPYEGDGRLSARIRGASKTSVAQDIKNEGLFRGESGRFQIELILPPETPIFLTEFTEDRYAPPRVLSNILYLP